MSNIIPVILCGGAGRRLRPLSNLERPKQFFKLKKNGLTLFQDTLKRAECFSAPIIVTSQRYKKTVEAQLAQVGVKAEAVICEPALCNTGPAIALALHYLQRRNMKDSELLVLPCDHLIEEFDVFAKLVEQAKDVAVKNIVLFGIQPTSPMTQYGYIEVSKDTDENQGTLMPVVSFKEKPNKEIASGYLASQNYYWNSGIFLMGYYAAIEAFREYAPALWFQVQNLDPLNLKKGDYKNMPAMGFDRLILEYAQNIVMQRCDVEWADIGSWTMFMRYVRKFHLFK